MFWQCSGVLVFWCSGVLGGVRVMFWRYSGSVLVFSCSRVLVFWWCFGDVFSVFWQCSGFWCSGGVLVVFWRCSGGILAVFCSGILAVFW